MKRISALTIIGTDPSGGTDIQTDLKALLTPGAYDCSVITASMTQNTRGVQSVYHIEPDFAAAQLGLVLSDVRTDTTKAGMLAETDIVEAVTERLRRHRVQSVALSAVMLTKSDDSSLSLSVAETLRTCLLPQVSITAPNLPEAAALLGVSHVQTEQEMLEQGRALRMLGCEAALIKGGHLDDAQNPDQLFTCGGEQRFIASRVMTKSTHGTGCMLSAMLAALCPHYNSWAGTAQEAKLWLSVALVQADALEVGQGIGPVYHSHV